MKNIVLVFACASLLLFSLTFPSHGAESESSLTQDPATGAVTGTVQADGKPCLVGMIDTNRDRKPDAFAQDLNGDGKLDPAESVPVTKNIEVAGRYYTFEGSPDGKTAKLKELGPQPKLGTIDTACPDVLMVLVSPDFAVRVRGTGGKRQLPVGQYKAVAVGMVRTDKDGAVWTLMGDPNTAKLQKIEIKEGEALTLKVGEPFTAKVIGLAVRGRSVAMAGGVLVGQVGEQYPLVAQKDGKALTPQKMNVVDKAEKVITTAAPRFG